MIPGKQASFAEVDEQGRLILPPEIARQYGLTPGAKVRVDNENNVVRLHRPTSQLTRLYVEPTDHCNLDCVTCYRNNWAESLGRMTDATYAHILDGIKDLDPKPTIFFGGIGEPTLHTHLPAWIKQAKDLGAPVEMITNGTLLKEELARKLIASGLDLLWVSIDGATPESYSDVRLGAELPQVLDNVRLLRKLRRPGHFAKPEIGVAFVAMKRNINELPEVLKIAKSLGAAHFKVSNVLAIDEQLRGEVLYESALNDITYMSSKWMPRLSMPKLPFTPETSDALFKAFSSGFNVNFAGSSLGGANDVCNFIESGALAIAWNGSVSPCLPLMHGHTHHINKHWRVSRAHIVGNVNQRGLLDIWHDPQYVAYRDHVQSFAFAPCTFCGGCEMLDGNEEDCLGNVFPACGGCLWAQGLIQCP
jgi:MoaA/NifB/PqqE/SkfB family radical SAM enzyme